MHDLLGNDTEWINAFEEVNLHATSQLRHLFTILIIFYIVRDPQKLFNLFWKNFTDDIMHELTSILGIPSATISEHYLKNTILVELEKILNRCCYLSKEPYIFNFKYFLILMSTHHVKLKKKTIS